MSKAISQYKRNCWLAVPLISEFVTKIRDYLVAGKWDAGLVLVSLFSMALALADRYLLGLVPGLAVERP